MPTDTFFGLSDEKKEKIIEAGKKEFASTTFDLTSIKKVAETRICIKSLIATPMRFLPMSSAKILFNFFIHFP